MRERLSELTVRDEHRLARRLHRAQRDRREHAKLLREVEQAEARIARRRAALPAAIAYPDLPVSARREDLLAALGEHQVVVVAGETGSGKTTQLPKLLLELGRGVRGTIAHTQPRRLAARTVAARIAQELGVPLGTTVGYAVRFDERAREDTLVRLMTDGLLLAEVRHDPLLRRYDTVIVDEAHERSLNVDFLLAYLHRILPRRPDLKLVITSATIEPARFAAHFGGAPVIEVTGRTYPVAIRYRPPEEDTDPADAIAEAVQELRGEGPGDVLVFLSGEREIRDTAEVLGGRFGEEVDVVPLFARLSAAEQARAFRPGPRRRVILATNVAETSLTVPGIRYVVDPGTARVSRYSPRLKVQRLPIEPISQASADQRAGRCGRVAEGVCIRLYAEEDFEARPRFTDPEIQRTNLAAVILQLAALGIGGVQDLEFLDPPDRRQIRDGVNLLRELGALDRDEQLTVLGRRLARLPVDPRLGRMVLEAGPRGCLDEVVVLAAALSIQDPRERPADKRGEAEAAHARFADERSDFLALLNLWRHLEERGRELSRSQFRKQVRAEHLHVLRVREWQDLAGQLRRAAREAGVPAGPGPAEPGDVHRALLAGLLSHVGVRDARRREYEGARGSRFTLWPGSALAKNPPSWVMVAELVETSRLFGRTAAQIQPAWLEPLAGDLLRRSYGEPRWDARRGSAVVGERVTLYGLPVVAGRDVPLARVDPAAARELFLRAALVRGEWEAGHAFLAENRRRIAEIEALEARARTRGLLAGEDALVAFFAARVPERVTDGVSFDRWWRDTRDDALLTYPRGLLVPGPPDLAGRPTAWRQGELTFPLSYRFDPGDPRDGVTVRVPLALLPRVRDVGFDWLVPALRHELVTALIRTLPKEQRRRLVPAPEVAARALGRLPPRRGRLLDALSAELGVPREAWDPSRLAPHLRLHICVEDDGGRELACGDDLETLRSALAPRLQERLAAAAPGLERHGLRSFVAPPREVALPGGVRAFPALVDEGGAVGVRLFATQAEQAVAMAAGTRRLLLLTTPSPLRFVRDRLSLAAQVALAGAPAGTWEDATAAAVDALVARFGGPAWDEEAWATLHAHVRGELADALEAVLAQVVAVLEAAREVLGRAATLTAEPLLPARRDVEAQVARLVRPGFVAEAGAARLPDLLRYLRAAERRLERVARDPVADATRLAEVHALEDRARGALRWELEELRVALFAQALGTRHPVSVNRLRRILDERGTNLGRAAVSPKA